MSSAQNQNDAPAVAERYETASGCVVETRHANAFGVLIEHICLSSSDGAYQDDATRTARDPGNGGPVFHV